MPCVVKIPELRTLYYLNEVPANRDDLERSGVEIVEGASVEVPWDLGRWPEGTDSPPPPTLGVSKADPKRYREFKSPQELEPAGFETTGMTYGGAYDLVQWARLVKLIPSLKAIEAIKGNDPPGAMDEAMRYIREAR
jgi:hypothetical protein